MDENGSQVKLVRCPKCENLLPELPDFSLYKCGGCGAVLKANKPGSRSDDLLEKLNEETSEGVSEKEKHICEEDISLFDNSSSKTQDKVSVKAVNQTTRLETMNVHHKQSNQDGDAVSFDGRYDPYLNGQFQNRMNENGHLAKANGEFSTFSYPHEGSSKKSSNFPHDFGVHRRVENLEHDRAELLRKIDELKIQLCSSSDAVEKPRSIPVNRTTNSNLYVHNSYAPEGPCKAILQSDHIYRDYKHRYDLNMGNIYPPNGVVRSSNQQPYHGQHNMGLNPKIFAPQNSVGSLNIPECSCFRCYRNCQIQSRVQQTTHRSVPHYISSGSYGLYGHNLARSSDFDFESGRLNGGLVRRAVIAQGTKRVSHPIVGGVPFLACPSCFVLLKIPKNIAKGTKNSKKVRCGACSELILVEIGEKGIVFKVPVEHWKVSTKGDVVNDEAPIEDVKTLDDYLKVDDCGNFTINSPPTNLETNAVSGDGCIESGQSLERQGPVSSSSSFSEDEQSPYSVIVVKENSNSADLALKDDPPLEENTVSVRKIDLDDDYDDFVFSRCGLGNKSKRASRQNSVKDVSVVTEKEVVYSDVAVSDEASEGEDQPRIDEESESFFGGFFKKSFKKLLRPSDSMEMSRIKVFVNGHPLSNRVVKKAEKFAGPIHPGNYWYDYRAGFWGVMGQPCHGIIPPLIEEFSYSMPRNCAAGNTGVFVNGRELHESDLDLLASRGLPTTRDKFYMIEISGRVVDEYTGEELDDLGKLAPTVEKVKHGFGMRPRTVAE